MTREADAGRKQEPHESEAKESDIERVEAQFRFCLDAAGEANTRSRRGCATRLNRCRPQSKRRETRSSTEAGDMSPQ